jgi:hypothetical protein
MHIYMAYLIQQREAREKQEAFDKEKNRIA